MILVLECSRAEVDQPNLSVQQDTALCSLSVNGSRGRRNLAVISEGLVRVVTEQDVLRLKIGMDQVEIMQN